MFSIFHFNIFDIFSFIFNVGKKEAKRQALVQICAFFEEWIDNFKPPRGINHNIVNQNFANQQSKIRGLDTHNDKDLETLRKEAVGLSLKDFEGMHREHCNYQLAPEHEARLNKINMLRDALKKRFKLSR